MIHSGVVTNQLKQINGRSSGSERLLSPTVLFDVCAISTRNDKLVISVCKVGCIHNNIIGFVCG